MEDNRSLDFNLESSTSVGTQRSMRPGRTARFSEVMQGIVDSFRIGGDLADYYDFLNVWNYPPLHDENQPTRWINLGYWNTETVALNTACRRLGALLADLGGICDGVSVVDVGCGTGEFARYLAENRRCASVTGVNILPNQVKQAIEATADSEARDRVRFVLGDAVKLDLEDASCDVVTALECAFHFNTRKQFLAEAHRCLRPGGRIVVADIVQRFYYPKTRIMKRICENQQTPIENFRETVANYGKAYEEAGFSEVRVRNITKDVFKPLVAHMLPHLRSTNYLHYVMSEFDLSRDEARVRQRRAIGYVALLEYAGLLTNYVVASGIR